MTVPLRERGGDALLLAGDEIGLLVLVLLNAAVLWSGWQFARRMESDPLEAAADALLLFYLVQYVCVCGLGVVGMLRGWTLVAAAVLCCAALLASGRGRTTSAPDSRLRGGGGSTWGAGFTRGVGSTQGPRSIWAAGAFAFVVGYLALLIWQQRYLPVISNDALTYHLPAAVEWLQTGKLGLYEAWFYNPANSYSPLAGSAFIAWLIAPLGNDAIARFVGVGPLILLMIAMLNLCRRLGAGVGAAALVAGVCVLARPFVSQVILAKDDLFVAAFFVTLVSAMARVSQASRLSRSEKDNSALADEGSRTEDRALVDRRFDAWRVGIVLGLLLATKYTTLLSLPIVLLMLGRGWNWRRGAVVIGCAIVLAGPWYVRNLVLTGNPLYPSRVSIGSMTLLEGMLDVQRSRLLESAGGVWNVFTGGYYGVPVALAVVVLLGWAAAVGISAKRGDGLKDSLRRTCLLGPVVGIALFVAVAPYGEMRFAYPSVALLFAAGAIALVRLPRRGQEAVAAAVLLLSAGTAFRWQLAVPFVVSGLILGGLAMAVAGTAYAAVIAKIAVAGTCVAAALVAYVHWESYVWTCEQDSTTVWQDPAVYGPMGEVWEFVRSELPPGTAIAYANTYFTYPLMGYRYDRRVVHVPTRADVSGFVEMPAVPETVSGEEIVGKVVSLLRERPDRSAWLARLRASGAKHLVVLKMDPAAPTQPANPVELNWAEAEGFERLFDGAGGSVFLVG